MRSFTVCPYSFLQEGRPFKSMVFIAALKQNVKFSISKRTTSWSFMSTSFKPSIETKFVKCIPKHIFHERVWTIKVFTNKLQLFAFVHIDIQKKSEKILSKTNLKLPILYSNYIILNKELKQSLREWPNGGILCCSNRSYHWPLWLSVWVPCGVFVVIQSHLRRR